MCTGERFNDLLDRAFYRVVLNVCRKYTPLAFNRRILNSTVLIFSYIQHSLRYIIISSNKWKNKIDHARERILSPFPFLWLPPPPPPYSLFLIEMIIAIM